MKFIRYLTLALWTCTAFAQNPYGTQFLPSSSGINISASSITSTPIPMGQSWSAGVIQLTGTSLSTATFGVLASTDNGSHYFAVPICTVAATPVCATTQTATANAQYTINLLGATYIEYVTSGTFTGASINLLLTVSPNAQLSKNSSGGGGTYTGVSPVVVTGTVISCPTCATGTVTTPTVRCSNLQASTATSFTISWCSGTAEGDQEYIFISTAGSSLTGPGQIWTLINNVSAGSYQGSVYERTLTAADIAAGSVSVSNNDGSGNCAGSVSVTGGTSFGPRWPAAFIAVNHAPPVIVDTTAASSDLMLYFACAFVGDADLMTSSLGTKLQQITSGGAGAIYAGSPASTGIVSPSFSWGPTGGSRQFYATAVSIPGH